MPISQPLLANLVDPENENSKLSTNTQILERVRFCQSENSTKNRTLHTYSFKSSDNKGRAEYLFGMHKKWCLFFIASCIKIKMHHVWCIPNKYSTDILLELTSELQIISFFGHVYVRKKFEFSNVNKTEK